MASASVEVAVENAAIAASLTARLPELCAELLDRLLGEIPELRGDEAVEELMAASARENVVTGIDVLAYEIDMQEVDAPPAAAEYARRLAQRGVPVEAMLRAYRLGHLMFLEWWLAEVERRQLAAPDSLAVMAKATGASFRYIDKMSEQLIGVYVGERNRWLQSTSATRATVVRRLLAGEVSDLGRLEAILSYALGRTHVGMVAWLVSESDLGEGLQLLDRVAAALIASTGASPLIVLADETTMWAWLPAERPDGIEEERLARAVEDAAAGVHLAVGLPAHGVGGFRTTHGQALRAQAVGAAAGAGGSTVTTFRDASLISFLTADLEAATAWIERALGPLALDDESVGRLRETVAVFLATKGSYTETAARLHMHKNTVHYRIRKAEELRGRPLDDDRVSLEVALLACERLGVAVLRPAGA